MIARAIAAGADPLAVYRAACWSPARHFGLNDRGLIAPGQRADLVLLSDLNSCRVEMVLKNGRIVNEELFAARGEGPDPSEFLRSIHRPELSAESFRVFSACAETPVIGIREGSLVTDFLKMELPRDGREKRCDPERDVAKVAVLERYGKNGNIGLGFVRGFGLKSGAVASSVGHDSHNLCVVGVSDADMALAVNALRECGGGFAVADRGRILDLLPLPLGGLLSCGSYETVCRGAVPDTLLSAASGDSVPPDYGPRHRRCGAVQNHSGLSVPDADVGSSMRLCFFRYHGYLHISA